MMFSKTFRIVWKAIGLLGARQVSQKSLVCCAEYSVAILCYCYKNI